MLVVVVALTDAPRRAPTKLIEAAHDCDAAGTFFSHHPLLAGLNPATNPHASRPNLNRGLRDGCRAEKSGIAMIRDFITALLQSCQETRKEPGSSPSEPVASYSGA